MQTPAESVAVCVRVRRSLVVDFLIVALHYLTTPEKGIRTDLSSSFPSGSDWLVLLRRSYVVQAYRRFDLCKYNMEDGCCTYIYILNVVVKGRVGD